MSTTHRFGGNWTEEKLERIKKYLEAYTVIFDRNEAAQYFTTHYVDAFAGTGSRESNSDQPKIIEGSLFANASTIQSIDDDSESLKQGSARVALQINPEFDNYLFIEKRKSFSKSLEDLKNDFPNKRNKISVAQGEANEVLQAWIRKIDWRRNRAVVFLDPYGMNVDWATIEAIGNTKAIDLWILFPLAQAVNRLLTKKDLPSDQWSNKLTKFFGTDEWIEAFYAPPPISQGSLFDVEFTLPYTKTADFETINTFFVNRLESVFAKVAPNPLPLKNSQNVPLFLLCFASANPKGATTAVKIANYILKH